MGRKKVFEGDTRQVAAWVNLDTHQKFRMAAARRGLSISGFLRELVLNAIQAEEDNQAA